MTTQEFNQESVKEIGSRIKGLVVESACIELSDGCTEPNFVVISFQGGHKLKICGDWTYYLEIFKPVSSSSSTVSGDPDE